MADVDRIQELNKALENELGKWDILGVEPNQVIAFNPVKNDIWLQCITKFLSDKGIIEEGEFVIYFKEAMLRELEKVRRDIVEPEVRKARIVRPDMRVPKNRKMH